MTVNIHHHHLFHRNDAGSAPLPFDGVLIHDHPDAAHWDERNYIANHDPFDAMIDDLGCDEDCRWRGVMVT